MAPAPFLLVRAGGADVWRATSGRRGGSPGGRVGQDKNPGDRAGAEAKFRRIAEAYEILSDPERRAAYDASVAGAARGAGDFAGAAWGAPTQDPFDLFRAFFGGQDPFQIFGSGQNLFGGFESPFGPAGGAAGPFGGSLMDSMMGGSMLGGSMLGGSMLGGSMLGGSMLGGSLMRPEGGFRAQSTSFSSSSMGAGHGVSRQMSSQTVISNGRRVTRTTTTVRHPDGTTETTTDEQEETGLGGYGGGGAGLLGRGGEVMRDDWEGGSGGPWDMRPH